VSPDRRAGFTLVETLVSLVVLGFIVVGLAQGLRFGMAAWDRQARSIDQDTALDSTDRILRALLSRMVPGVDPHVPAVAGDGFHLAFTAELPVNAPASPTRLADLTLGANASHRLVLAWTPHLHARLLGPAVLRQATLLSGVRQVTFAYFRPPSGQQPAVWVNQWQSVNPPALVRVHIEFENRAQHWPDVIVAPMCEANND
jgi:general secretion pathway protein J